MRLVFRIIGAFLPSAEREWMLGDLHEEFLAIAESRGAGAANRWLVSESVRIALGALRLRRAASKTPSEGTGDRMRTVIQDVKYAGRLLVRSPVFTLIAVLTLAVGIGANTAIFSVVHGVLIRPLPYPNPDRLVRLFEEAPRSPKFPLAPADFRDYRAELQTFDGLAAYIRGDLQIAGDDHPEQLRGMRVTAGFFALLGCQPLLGREFLASEEIAGNDDAIILGHGLWQRRFHADRGIIGQPVRLSGRVFRVVGVLPPGFQHVGGTYQSYAHGDTVDVWWVRPVPRDNQPRDRFSHYFNVVGRLKPGVSVQQANAEIGAAAVRVASRYPGGSSPWTARAVPLKEEIIGTAEPTLVALQMAAGVVLLLACVNVAGLLLGRATARMREIGVRAALGATRLRLVRQLVVEGMVLSFAGGGLGILLAYGVVTALGILGPADTPRLHMVAVDRAVLGYTVAASLLTSLLFGLAPAVQLAFASVGATLQHGGRGTAGAAHQRLRRVLVGAEVALAFVLVVAAGLLLRSFAALSSTDAGFRPEGVLTATVTLPAARFDSVAAAAFYERLCDRIRALPGVRDAGFTSDLPWTGYDENTSLGIVGRQFPQNQGPEARYHFVTPGTIRALSVPVAAGRDLTASDRRGAPPVVLVNESLARRYWKTPEAAIGARLNLWGAERTIAGVIGNVRDAPWTEEVPAALYFPQAQEWYSQDMFLTIRTDAAPASLVEPVRAVLHDLDPALPLANVRGLDEVAGAAFGTRRFVLLLVGAFAMMALFLAVVGIYGVMAQAVGQRLREFGVRQALGAQPYDILRLVFTSGAAVGVAGIAAGAAIALATTRLLSSLLYRVNPSDPATFVSVGLLLMVVALGASYIPARRATRVDPAVVLRGE